MARHDDNKHWPVRPAATGTARWPLIEKGVAVTTKKDYKRGVSRFLSWCSDRGCDAQSYDALDDLLADYFQTIYLQREGKGRQLCVNTLAGVLLYLPRADGKLAVSARMLKAWRKDVPS